MDLLYFVFELGVVFAIFGFVWFFIQLGYSMLRSNAAKGLTEFYIIRMVRYFFLSNVIILLTLNESQDGFDLGKGITAGLILLVLFVSQLQRNQFQSNMIKMSGNLLSNFNARQFNLKSEVFVISFAVVAYVAFLLFPEYAKNAVSYWFYETIVGMMDAPFFGFIFKVVGFFYMMMILNKLVSGLLGRGKLSNDDIEEDDRFDDYEEIN